MPDRTCVECGVPVTGQGRKLYCSPECRLVDRTCQWCGHVDRVERKRQDRPFCSQACAKAHGGFSKRCVMVACTCQWCGGEFLRYPSKVKDTNRCKFCSKRCAALGRKINGRPSVIATNAIDAWREHNTELCIAEHRVGQWSVDLAFPLRMLAVELDGAYWHSLPAMVEKDARKDAALTAAGWHVERIVIHKDDTPDDLAERIAAAVARSDSTWKHHATT